MVVLTDLMTDGYASIQWTTTKPSSSPTLPVRLCLSTTGRLAVTDGPGKELAVLYTGPPAYAGSGPFAAYLMVSPHVAWVCCGVQKRLTKHLIDFVTINQPALSALELH